MGAIDRIGLAALCAALPLQEAKVQLRNGMRADQLAVRWRKSRLSNPSGSCVEVAELPGGEIAVRNSRHPSGPALVYPRAEISAFLTAAKTGEFDDLYRSGNGML